MLDKEQFLAERAKGLGGSDSPVVLGVSRWKTRYQLWLEKTGQAEEQEPNAAMLRGIQLERIALDMYNPPTGTELRSASDYRLFKTHSDFPFITGHPDAFEFEDDFGKNGIIEVKCPASFVLREHLGSGVPDEYLIQIQHYMLLYGSKYGKFVLLDYNDWKVHVIEVEPLPEVQDIIVRECIKFWGYVENGIAPDEVLPGDLEEIPSVKGAVIQNNDPEWAIAVDDYRNAKELSRSSEEIEDMAKQQLIELMDDNDAMEGAGFRCYNRVSIAGKRSFRAYDYGKKRGKK